MRYLFLALLFTSCNPLRHYHKVQQDFPRSAEKRKIIRDVYTSEYPKYLDTVIVERVKVDSSAYKNQEAAEDQIIDLLLESYAFIDSLQAKDSPRVTVSPRDSLRIIRNYRARYQPKPIVVEKEKIVPARDNADLDACQFEKAAIDRRNSALTAEVSDLKGKIKTERSNNGWWAGGGMLGMLILLLILRITTRKI